MANFGVSILDTSGKLDVVANGTVITVIDHSNYSTNLESGHAQSDFDGLYKIKFLNPDSTTYLFSSIGDGDATLSVPSICTLPITTNYTYSTGDGVYAIYIYTVPTYNGASTYEATTDYVYYNNTLYKCILASTGNLPTDVIHWEAITDIDDLPNKYRLYERFAVTCDIQQCYMNSLYSAYCGVDGINCNNNLCDNEDFILSAELHMINEYVSVLVDNNDWAGVSHVINYASDLCCCND